MEYVISPIDHRSGFVPLAVVVSEKPTDDEVNVIQELAAYPSDFGMTFSMLCHTLGWKVGRLRDVLNSLVKKGDVDRMEVPHGKNNASIERFVVHHPVV